MSLPRARSCLSRLLVRESLSSQVRCCITELTQPVPVLCSHRKCRALRATSFSADPFLGHGSGIIPAPGSFASSAFPVPPCESSGPSQNAAARLGSSIHFALGCPKEMGQKRRNKNVSESRSTHRLPRKRSGETASPRQRCELHRPVRRHPAVVERRERRVAVQNRVAPRRCFQPPRRVHC